MTDATVFVGGRVFTGRRYCEALLLENGHVLVAGSREEAIRTAPSGADRRELDGALVLPGLIDAHFHVADVTRSREGLDLYGVSSVPNLVEKVRSWAAGHPGDAIVGRGWDPERFPEHSWPTREDLDRATLDRAMVAIHVSGHAAVANSAALEVAGIDRATNDPPGGRIGRSPDGTPDGRVFEAAISRLFPLPSTLAPPEPGALRRTLQWATTLGLTTIGAMSATPEEATALRELSGAGSLPARIRVYLHGARWEDYFRQAPGPVELAGRFAVVGVKAYADGAFGTRTAWLTEPYADDPGNSGMPVATEEQLISLLEASGERGLAPALHAIGDRAVGYCLELLGRTRRSAGAPARIEHVALTPPALFGPLQRVRPALVVQPGFLWSDHWLGERLGPSRARWAYVFRTLMQQGHLLVGSSDAPYDPADPWRGIQAAVRRVDVEGRSANGTAEEALSPEEAISLYTVNAGVALGDPTLGWLEPGGAADFLLLGAPSLERAVDVGSGVVRETWVAGERVYRDQASSDPETV